MAKQSATFEDLAAVPPTDATVGLVRGVLDGQPDAEAEFYEIFLPIVKRLIRKWNAMYYKPQGRPALDEEDESQGILVRLIYGRRMQGEQEGGPSALRRWLEYEGPRRKSLYRYVQWNAHFCLRDANRRNCQIGPQGCGVSHKSEPNAYSDADSNGQIPEDERWQLRHCIRKCWERLNPSHREVLEKVSLVGLTQAETALKLGVGESTISRWLREATKRLETCLRENCPEGLLPFANR